MQGAVEGRRVGRVVGLWRYPVKSMAGEALSEVDVSWHGLAGDRRWAFVRDGVRQSGFPWLTLRERNDMNRYRPAFLEPTRPDKSPLVVTSPSGSVFDITDPALATELHPGGAQVIKQDRGIFDTFPLSLISTRTLTDLGESVGIALDAMRFRPNFLIEAEGGDAFPEDGWLGGVLQIGSLRLRVDQRDGRCMVITLDPATAERNPAVLRAVAQEREGCLGVYASTVQPGRVAIGDEVSLESS